VPIGRHPPRAIHYRWTYARRTGLFRAARRIGADAVHFGDPNATPLFMGLTACRRILTCHDTIPLRYPERYMGVRDGGPRLGRAIERRRYRTADLVIAVSDATRDDACTLLGVAPERVVRVYNGIAIDRWSATESNESGILQRRDISGRRFALYVGGPDWHKNVEGMLGGLAHARRQGSISICSGQGTSRRTTAVASMRSPVRQASTTSSISSATLATMNWRCSIEPPWRIFWSRGARGSV